MTLTPYEPVTDRGTGVLIPAAKALGHLMLVHQAVANGWGLTNEQARAEIEEALVHANDLSSIADLVATETYTNILGWRAYLLEQLTVLKAELSTAESLDAAVTPETLPAIQDIVQATWATLSAIDRDLTDLRNAEADPGRLP